ncbi:hypothetical protein CA54_15510 [Symmachiella macrocystis]|uniref:DUF3500 domain-containing protein n=1 Tax=Symmachiella macrocystis TaxID=2527985 RepID=A0A5C6BN44_9PLAN|nr:DUF3500 domain-containing protein [Symmachiella macrocystis]TWU12726.1 hypothetical protein CA54_15510 [Symmachiella macrocystis]
MRSPKPLIAFVVMAAMGTLLWAGAEGNVPSGERMIVAAAKFENSLNAKQRSKAEFQFDDEERLNWHFIPRERKGLPLKDLEGEALKAAHNLIQSGLSDAGYTQALDVMSLEEVVYLLEQGDRQERRERRDPDKYYLSLFGKPSPQGKWGWRLEGHHLSLNFVVQDGQVVSSTPEFFGANPGYISAGPGREIRVLAAEEDFARQIVNISTPQQLKTIWISEKADRDIRGAGESQPVVTDPIGLAYRDMSDEQQKLLSALLSEYLRNMPQDISQQRHAELKAAGLDDITLAWWGGRERNEPHAYRLQGPTFIVEYNNTQNSANHIHSIWRSLSGDFDVARNQ